MDVTNSTARKGIVMLEVLVVVTDNCGGHYVNLRWRLGTDRAKQRKKVEMLFSRISEDKMSVYISF